MVSQSLSPEHEALARRTVLISGFAAFIIFGIRLSFSVFFAEFVAVEGWSNEAAAGIFSVSMLVFAFGSAPAGVLLDKFGPRVVFTIGVLLLALGLSLSSFANSVGQLALTYGLVGGSGLAVIGLGPVAANIAAWVSPQARGRAIGIAFAGTGLGSLIFVPMCTYLIDEIGWRQAYIVLSLICLFILAPTLAWGLRKAPKQKVQSDTPIRFRDNLVALLSNRLFWVMMLISLMALGPLRSLTVHQVAYIEATGIERQTAATYVGLAGFLTAGTFIMWGFVSDRFGRGWAFNLGALALASAVGILFLLRATPMAVLLIPYAILLALGEGTRSSQSTALASDLFQPYGLGLVNGIVGAMFGFGAAFGPWIVGRLRDQTGTYTSGLIIVLAMIAISVVSFTFLTTRKKL